jgi:prolipoprotein diacylglyceryltransferase
MENGIYNSYLQEYLFPVQLLEAVLSFAFVFVLLRRAKKRNYVADGTGFRWMLILYGTARFFTEFLHDNPKIALGCSFMSFYALAMVISGVLGIIRIRTKKPVGIEPLYIVEEDESF